MSVKLTAEIASNHSGSLDLAKQFIQEAARLGVDTVKFQSSRFEDLVNKEDPQADWVKQTSLSDEDHFVLMEECAKQGVEFLTTCFSLSRIEFLSSLGMKSIKVASPDLLSFQMIEKLASHFDHLIISTGMHSIRDIKKAIQFLLDNDISATLMHSVSIYPTPIEKSLMSKFLWLKEHYPRVGYSNHVSETEPIKLAMSYGAEIVEFHMKLGEDGPGRATAFDLTPEQINELAIYREKLNVMLDEQKVSDDEFLFEEEIKARERFIHRWGNNQ